MAIYVYLGDPRLPLLAGLGLAVTAAAPVALVQESPLIAWRIAASPR